MRIPVYVINLKRAPERLARMQVEATRLGFEFSLLYATDGRDPVFLHSLGPPLPSQLSELRMAPTEVACFQSHRRVWRRILDNGSSHSVVLEDDLVFTDDFASILNSDWIPGDADIVRIETRKTLCHLSGQSKAHVAGRKVRRLLSMHGGTGAYIISSNAACRLLDLTVEIRDPIDQVLFNDASPVFEQLRVYQLIPAPVIQGDIAEHGDIGEWARSSLHQDRLRTGAVRSPFRKRVMRLPKIIRGKLKASLRGTIYGAVPFA
jgi:glycosyl transferase, family 25